MFNGREAYILFLVSFLSVTKFLSLCTKGGNIYADLLRAIPAKFTTPGGTAF